MIEHEEQRRPREHAAQLLTAAAYGTVLVLAALPLLTPAEVESGVGWELVAGVGVATWIAHLYAEAVGDHVRRGSALDGAELRRAMSDGLPILLAAVPPGVALALGRLGVLEPNTARWTAVAVAIVQLVGVGVLVGSIVSKGRARTWSYAAATALIGVGVVAIKLMLGH